MCVSDPAAERRIDFPGLPVRVRQAATVQFLAAPPDPIANGNAARSRIFIFAEDEQRPPPRSV
jgi:hypothetical protein